MTQRHDSNPTLGAVSSRRPGARRQKHFRKVPGAWRATGNLPGDRPGAPPALESDLLPSTPGGVSNLQASPSSFRSCLSTTPIFLPQSVTQRVCARRRAPPSSPPPPAPRSQPRAPLQPGHAHPSSPTPRLLQEPLPSHPARARRPGTRGTNSAGSCCRQTPVPPGLREIWSESIGNSGRVLARFKKFPTARVVSESSSGRRWEGGVA